jgi:RNA-binding protein YhbY
MGLIKVHIGKNGLTREFIQDLRVRFVNSQNARIGLLKNSTRDKKVVKEWAEKIVTDLGKQFTYKIIGYTIVLTKWRKPRTA